jgi:homoserine kinase
VVASLEALNRLHRYPLTTPELFGLMAQMEGGISGEIHTDNIGPCLFGGLRLCPPGDPFAYALPWPAAWRVVVCWPGTRLETRDSRSVLPGNVPLKTSVQQSATFASFIHALHAGDTALAARSIKDLIAEPHRSKLLPGFAEAKAALGDLGALAVGISGSGPSMFAIVDDFEVGNAVEAWLADNYRGNDRGFVHVCRAELGGARSIS